MPQHVRLSQPAHKILSRRIYPPHSHPHLADDARFHDDRRPLAESFGTCRRGVHRSERSSVDRREIDAGADEDLAPAGGEDCFAAHGEGEYAPEGRGKERAGLWRAYVWRM